MSGRPRIVSRFLVALFCFWLAGMRIEDKCGAVQSGCLGRLDWQDWLLIIAGAGLLSAALFGLSRQAVQGRRKDESR
jgi:hypothetical protein